MVYDFFRLEVDLQKLRSSYDFNSPGDISTPKVIYFVALLKFNLENTILSLQFYFNIPL